MKMFFKVQIFKSIVDFVVVFQKGVVCDKNIENILKKQNFKYYLMFLFYNNRVNIFNLNIKSIEMIYNVNMYFLLY